jgi:hypothetical protein
MPKKKFLVVSRNTKTSENGLMTGKGLVPFHNKTARMIDDEGLANEIDTHYGIHGTGDVWVERDPHYESTSNYHDGISPELGHGVHKFFFGPTKAYSEAWERIFGKEHKNANSD